MNINVRTWHWRTGIAGAVFSIGLGLAAPLVDMWLGRPLGWAMVHWALLVTVYLGGIGWGLSHGHPLRMPDWLALQFVTLPVTLAIIVLQLELSAALPILIAGVLALLALDLWLVWPNHSFALLRTLYGAAIAIGLMAAWVHVGLA